MVSQVEKFLHHGGYYGSVEVNLEDELLHGRVMYIRDAITYEGNDLASLKTAFVNAVDCYLAFCKKVGDEPNKPFSGTFNVRIPQALHREAAITADKAGISLNKLVEEAIEQRLFAPKISKSWASILSALSETHENRAVNAKQLIMYSAPRWKQGTKLQVVK